MGIRKDLNDMLNNLRNDETAHSSTESPQLNNSIHRKSKYDDMSIDDLLNTLTAEKAAEAEPEQPNESEAISEEAPPKHKRIVISAELPDYEAIRQRELEKDRLEKERIEAEKRERERLERERIEAEKREQERLERERLEAEKREQERLERERLEAEKREQERLERERLEAEKREQERLERERLEAEKREQERLERERLEAEKREQERLERERLEAEKREQERLERERLEAEKREQERLERERLEAEKREQERLERERIEAEKREQERLERERLEAEKREQERLERERLEAEKREQERLERERLEAETAAQQSADEENTSAEDLINSALESIRNSEMSDNSESTKYAEEAVPENDDGLLTNDNAPDNADIESDGSDVENNDIVESLIDGMREDAENAIAELDKPSPAADDETDEPPTDTEDSVPKTDKDDESAETPPKKGLISTLNNILDESSDEIISERSEKNEEDTADKKHKGSFKRKLYTVLGAVFSVLAVIGLVTVIIKGIGLIRGFSSGEIKKDSFTEIIYPAVIMDIESFNDPSELTSEQMLTAAIWSMIMDEDTAAKYGKSAGIDILSIPDTDVEARAVEMFGTNHPEFVHSTIGPVESRFYYSDGVYNVEPRPVIFTYSPEITKIVKSGSEYTLTVDYISEMPEWVDKTVAKTAEYKLTEEDDGKYRINSMKILVKNTNL